jgi:lipopolysaccharide/colanic/teichoic acid biosynthesis glycosyltransferase
MVKSVFDIIISALALGFLSPLFLFVAIILKTQGSKEVFFRQKRAGKELRNFIYINLLL